MLPLVCLTYVWYIRSLEFNHYTVQKLKIRPSSDLKVTDSLLGCSTVDYGRWFSALGQ